MQGGTNNLAKVVITNENNVTDQMSWIQQVNPTSLFNDYFPQRAYQVHQSKLYKMKQETQRKQIAALTNPSKGGQRVKDLDNRMALRNGNVRANSLLKMKINEDEISKKNLMLGEKIAKIKSRKRSLYGEIETVTHKQIDMQGVRINQSSQSNFDYFEDQNLTQEQKQKLMFQISMTSMNEHDYTTRQSYQGSNVGLSPSARQNLHQVSGDNFGMVKQASTGKVVKANLGVVEKVKGPLKYVIPNENYINADIHQQMSLKRTDKNTTDTVQETQYDPTINERLPINLNSPMGQTMYTQMGHAKRESNLGDKLTSSPVRQQQKLQNFKDFEKTSLAQEINQLQLKNSQRKKMSETQRNGSNGFIINKRTEHIQSLTPVNVIKHPQIKGQIPINNKNRKASVQGTSLGGVHHLQEDNSYNFMHTQEHFPSVVQNEDQNMGKTHTSFMTANTSRHMYMEVPRQSIFNILNQQQQSQMGHQTSRSVFNTRHKSLNEGARKQENLRIDRENMKLHLQMFNMKASPILQVKKLEKQYQKQESLKKQIVLTKHLRRNEILVKNAIKKRHQVFQNLPPVQSPLHRNAKDRRNKQSFQTIQHSSNVSASHGYESQNFYEDNSGQDKSSQKEMLMLKHDQSVQRVNAAAQQQLANMPVFASKFSKRHYSVGGKTLHQLQSEKEKSAQNTAIKIYERQLGKQLKKNSPRHAMVSDNSLARNINNSFITGGADLTEKSPQSLQQNYNKTFRQLKQLFENNDQVSKNLQQQYSSRRFILNSTNSSPQRSKAMLNELPKSLIQLDQEIKRRNYYKNKIGFNTTKMQFLEHDPSNENFGESHIQFIHQQADYLEQHLQSQRDPIQIKQQEEEIIPELERGQPGETQVNEYDDNDKKIIDDQEESKFSDQTFKEQEQPSKEQEKEGQKQSVTDLLQPSDGVNKPKSEDQDDNESYYESETDKQESSTQNKEMEKPIEVRQTQPTKPLDIKQTQDAAVKPLVQEKVAEAEKPAVALKPSTVQKQPVTQKPTVAQKASVIKNAPASKQPPTEVAKKNSTVSISKTKVQPAPKVQPKANLNIDTKMQVKKQTPIKPVKPPQSSLPKQVPTPKKGPLKSNASQSSKQNSKSPNEATRQVAKADAKLKEEQKQLQKQLQEAAKKPVAQTNQTSKLKVQTTQKSQIKKDQEFKHQVSNPMNNTFSSNMVINSQKSHSPVKIKENINNSLPATPEIHPESPKEDAKTPEAQPSSTPGGQKQVAAPQNPIDVAATSSDNYESSYESDEPEEDISKRKAFDLIGEKRANVKKKNSKPINWDMDNSATGKVVSMSVQKKSKDQVKNEIVSKQQSTEGMVKAMETSKKHSSKDNKDDSDSYEDDEQFENESSKMQDSHAKESDDYASDNDFFDGKPGNTKNAEEYFQELEENKSRDTPEGQANSNADGGSIFNQTGGGFLNRGNNNGTKTSNYSAANMQLKQRTTGNMKSIEKLDEQENENNYLSQTQKQKKDSEHGSNQSPLKITKVGSNLSKAALQSLVGGKHRESSSRYELYAEDQEDKLANNELTQGFGSGSPSHVHTSYKIREPQTNALNIQSVDDGNSSTPAKVANLARQGSAHSLKPPVSSNDAQDANNTDENYTEQDSKNTGKTGKKLNAAPSRKNFQLNDESSDEDDNYLAQKSEDEEEKQTEEKDIMVMDKNSSEPYNPTVGNKASVARYEIQNTGMSSGHILETRSAAIDQVIKQSDSKKAEIMVKAAILNEESSSGPESSYKDSEGSESSSKDKKKESAGTTIEEKISQDKIDASESATQRDPSSVMLTAHQVGLEPIEQIQIKETDAAAEDESSGNKKDKAQDESGGEDYSDDDFD